MDEHPVPPWIDEQIVEADERWEIDGPGKAEWAMVHVVAATERIAEAEAQAAIWRARIDDWLSTVTLRDRATVEFMAGHLERHALAERERTGRATYQVPSGVVRTRKVRAKFDVTDPDELDKWADDVDDVTIRRVSKALLNEACEIQERTIGQMCTEDGGREPIIAFAVVHKATGAVVPGVTVTPEHYAATVSPILEVDGHALGKGS